MTYYQTQLRYKVWQSINDMYGFFGVRELARTINERANSVLYQLQNLVDMGVVRKVGKKYVSTSWLSSYGGRKATISTLQRLKRKPKNGVEVFRKSLQHIREVLPDFLKGGGGR